MNLWEHACKLIPGGNQLVSKRPYRYCQNWPSHYTWASGNMITASDGKQYKDFSTMGVGACVLGYGNAEVDAAVLQAIAAGQFSSLNSIEELELAEEILKINPKMDMVRFARTGGEACAIATRIAEVYRPGEFHLQHGYSGWILGFPEKSWRGFTFDNKEQLELFEPLIDDISYIIMESVRNYPDASIRLMKDAKEFSVKYGIPLIFDEITSGFRCNIGGYHATKGIYPDIAVYGKALGNGYPISCVVGKKEVMESAEKTFISSTFWSERTGYAAALATLSEMRRRKCPEYLIQAGCYVQDEMELISAETGMDINVTGIPPLTHLEFKEENNLNMSLYSQEMLKKGLLASDQYYASMAHTKEGLEMFIENASEVITRISRGKVKLDGNERTPGWRRVN